MGARSQCLKITIVFEVFLHLSVITAPHPHWEELA